MSKRIPIHVEYITRTGPRVSTRPLQKRNSKVNALTWSMTPIKSCPGATECADEHTCYACHGKFNCPDVKNAMDLRFDAVRTAEGIERTEFLINWQLESEPEAQIVRVHVAGDFFSPRYVDMWERIARKNPKRRFYAYTKSLHLRGFKAAFDRLTSHENFRLLDSLCDGEKNYGDEEYIARLVAKMKAAGKKEDEDYHICDYSQGDRDHCMTTCFACLHLKQKAVVFFREHR